MLHKFVCSILVTWSVTQVRASDSPGFAMWTADQLKQHDRQLPAHVGRDHSSRETLADYGTHRFRMLYRDADGNPEFHTAFSCRLAGT